MKRWWQRFIVMTAVVGPGLITAFADNDAAGVATYSVSAALFGYQMLTVLVPVTVVLAVTQEIGARIAIVTQQGLADLIRERYGIRVSVGLFLLIVAVNMAVIIQDVSGIRAALELFRIPWIALPAIMAVLYFFVVLANYKSIQRFFFLLIGFYITYIVSAFMAKPDWRAAVSQLAIPSGTFSPAYLYTAVAVLGTTVTAWGQFFVHSYIKDKHLTADHLRYSQAEVYIGAVLTDLFSFFMMVAVAATLFSHQIKIFGAADAAMAIKPFAGEFAGALFGVGLLVAGMLGAVIVPLSTAYVFAEFFGISGSLDERFQQSRLFYILFLLQIAAATAIVMLPRINLFRITLAANFVNGLILPVIFFFLYKVANNVNLMGKHKNTKFQNILVVGAGVIISAAAILGAAGQLLGW